jgi:putative transcriptional regulator
VESLRGQLLVASPSLIDLNFRRTVLLVGEHGDEGAMGVVLNRPSDTTVAEAAEGLAPLVEAGDVVHVGGPVSPEAVVVLAEVDDPSLTAELVLGDAGFLRGDLDLEDVATADLVRRARVFAGYAGWTPGQLEAELETTDWLVEPALPDDLFAPPEHDLWAEVVRRKGGSYRLVATMPFDPTLN